MEKSLELKTILTRGIRPEIRQNKSTLVAETFKGLRPGADGARLPDRILMPFTAATLAGAGVAMSMPEFPQILESHGEYLVAEDDNLYNIGTLEHRLGPTISAAITYGIAGVDGVILAGGGRWDYVQIGLPKDLTQLVIVQNDNNLVFINYLFSGPTYKLFTTADFRLPRTLTYHQGRFIRGGWNAPYGADAAFPSGWNTIFEAWFAETRDDWGWSTNSGTRVQDPQPNWIFYSTPGEDDYLYHLLPDIMTSGIDDLIDLDDDIIYGLNLFLDPSFKEDPIGGRIDSPVTDPWKWYQGFSLAFTTMIPALAEPLAFPSGPSLELAAIYNDSNVTGPDFIEIDPSEMLSSFVEARDYLIEFTYSFNLQEGLKIEAYLGGTQFLDRAVTAGEASTDIVDQVFNGVVECGGANSARLGVVTLVLGLGSGGVMAAPPEMLRIHSIIVREGLTRPYENPSSRTTREDIKNDYFILESMRRNQAGFLLMPFGGEVLKVKNLAQFVIVYGQDGVASIQHHQDKGMALSYMGLNEEVWGAGCAAKEAVTGDEKNHYWIDAIGNLWTINGKLQGTRLGYREFLRKLIPSITGASTTNPIMSFDETEQRVSISGIEADGTHRTYIYDRPQDSFYETNQKISTIHVNENRLVGIVEDQTDFEVIEVKTNLMSLGTRGLKELNQVSIDSEKIRNPQMDVSFNTEGETLYSTGNFSPNDFGVFYNRASGRELQFDFTGDGYQDVLDDGSFASGSDWTAGGNWAIGGGLATHTGADAGNLVSVAGNIANALVEDSVYMVEYDINTITGGGTVNVEVGGTSGILHEVIGRIQELVIAGSGATIEFTSLGNSSVVIDNVRVMLTGARLDAIEIFYDEADKRFRMSPNQKGIQG